jgi:hypothetical protein
MEKGNRGQDFFEKNSSALLSKEEGAGKPLLFPLHGLISDRKRGKID